MPQATTASNDSLKGSGSRQFMTPIKKTSSRDLLHGTDHGPSIDKPDPQVLFSPSGKSKLAKDDMVKRYDEWLKIAAENKINVKNTWNLALIDYFSDMSIIKDTENGQINFQKASCTLDGCVKIYTSRVDSVVDETGRLLHGLADAQSVEHSVNAADDVFDEPSGKASKPRKNKSAIASDTLAKTTESLNMKRLEDVEFSVDPLFRKMCYEFDENSSRGHGGTAWLLSNLQMSPDGQLLLDSGDTPLDIVDKAVAAQATLKDQQVIELPAEYASVFDEIHEDAKALLEKMKTIELWSAETGGVSQPLPHFQLELMDEPEEDREAGGLAWEDFGPGSDQDSMPSYQQTNNPLMDKINDLERLKSLSSEQGTIPEEMEELKDEPVISMSIDGETQESLNFRYFPKSWAGPEHWKLSHVTSLLQEREKKTAVKTTTRRVKQTLDFSTAPEVDIRSLFAKPSNPSALMMTLDPSTKERLLLPEDLKINATQMLKFFTKPTVSILSARQKKILQKKVTINVSSNGGTETTAEAAEEAVNMQFIREIDRKLAVNHHEAQSDLDADNDHDVLGEGGFCEEDAMDVSSFDGHLGSTGASSMQENNDVDAVGGSSLPSLVKPTLLNLSQLSYAKTAKPVDIGVLKAAILDRIKNSGNNCTLSQVMDKQEVALSFVSLLHLANENSLLLEATETFDDILIVR